MPDSPPLWARHSSTGVRRTSSLLVASALVLFGGIGGCGNESAHAEALAPELQSLPPIPVRIAPVETKILRREIHGMGVMEVKTQLELSFKVGGLVESVRVEEGDRVRRGQVLAAIDRTEVRAELGRAARLLEKAERDLHRTRELHAQGATHLAALQDAETAYEVAVSSEALARFNLKHSVITAPQGGVVETRNVEEGELVAPGRRVFTMVGAAHGTVVRARVAEKDAVTVRVGDAAEVVVPALSAEGVAARVESVSRFADSATGTFEVELALTQPVGSELLSGLSARVTIFKVGDRTAVIPIESFVDGNGDRGAVFVVEDGSARRVPVTVSFVHDAELALASSTRPLDAVITQGVDQLTDGALVAPVQ